MTLYPCSLGPLVFYSAHRSIHRKIRRKHKECKYKNNENSRRHSCKDERDRNDDPTKQINSSSGVYVSPITESLALHPTD